VFLRLVHFIVPCSTAQSRHKRFSKIIIRKEYCRAQKLRETDDDEKKEKKEKKGEGRVSITIILWYKSGNCLFTLFKFLKRKREKGFIIRGMYAVANSALSLSLSLPL
jgi:hypothetical protein